MVLWDYFAVANSLKFCFIDVLARCRVAQFSAVYLHSKDIDECLICQTVHSATTACLTHVGFIPGLLLCDCCSAYNIFLVVKVIVPHQRDVPRIFGPDPTKYWFILRCTAVPPGPLVIHTCRTDRVLWIMRAFRHTILNARSYFIASLELCIPFLRDMEDEAVLVLIDGEETQIFLPSQHRGRMVKTPWLKKKQTFTISKNAKHLLLQVVRRHVAYCWITWWKNNRVFMKARESYIRNIAISAISRLQQTTIKTSWDTFRTLLQQHREKTVWTLTVRELKSLLPFVTNCWTSSVNLL